MARSKKRTKGKAGGPYLAAAVFCDNVVEGADRTMSAIRIVDHVKIGIPPEAPADLPSENNRLNVSVWALVAFKRGYATRMHDVRLAVESPTGKRSELSRHEIDMSAEPYGGGNMRINLNIGVSRGGLFWVDVILDGKVITRMPLQITVTRLDATPQIDASAAKKSRKRT
jgi:hypothetical protein